MAHIRGVNLSNEGLIFSVDARNRKSYAGTGTSLTNLKHINKDATLNNSPALVSSAKFTIDGTDDYISFPQSSLFENQNFTINLWCKLGSVNNVQGIFHYGNASDLTKGITFYTNNGSVEFAINTYNSNVASYSFSDTTNVRMWTITYDSSNLRIYLDGSQVAIQSETATVDYTNANGGAVFALENGSFFKDGEFHNLQIYNRALTATEIRNNYLATQGGIGVALGSVPPTSPSPAPPPPSIVSDNLWIDLRPDDYSSSTVNDQSGNSRNATMTNGASITTAPDGSTAFYCDGVNDYVLYESSSTPNTGFPFTCEAWIYRDSSNTTTFNHGVVGKPKNSRNRFFDFLISSQDGNSSDRGAIMRYYTNTSSGSTNSYNAYGQSSITDTDTLLTESEMNTALGTSGNVWVHSVGVWYLNGSGRISMKGYINGSLVIDVDGNSVSTAGGTASTGLAWPWEDSSSVCQFGYGYQERYTVADVYKGGYTGDYRLYTDELTSSEVLNNFNATKSNYGY